MRIFSYLCSQIANGMTQYTCYLFHTRTDRVLPSDFLPTHHVHILCKAGELRFSDGRKQYRSHKDDLVIWQMSNTIGEVEYSDNFEADFFIISNLFLQHYNPEMTWATRGYVFIRLNPSFHLEGEALQIMQTDFRLIQERQSADSVFRQEILGRVLQIFLYDMYHVYSEHISQWQPDDTASQFFLRFMTLAQQHCIQERDVAFYAAKLCITPKYLSEICRRVTSMPATEWIGYCTSFEIARRLADPTKTLSEIAYDMNFSSLSFFTRYVRQHFGKTPTALRAGK